MSSKMVYHNQLQQILSSIRISNPAICSLYSKYIHSLFKISDREYDLVMQNDNNSCGNNQWFYFSV